ncbi:hypothetical protein [Sphingobacterium sp.]|uniref:hypothetical protein n=1 Tax=Sphingobacterium sp. TaxID=341027 RepID=UPI0028A76718|nr:hypothetical protein [Sphingobacterium sp.]
MKRFGIYTLLIILMVACRQKKETNNISGKEFLESVFPTYSPIGAEFSKVVDAVVEFDTARYVLDKNLDLKFYDPRFGRGYYNSSLGSEFDMESQLPVLELASEKLSSDIKDLNAYQTQLLDTEDYPNYTKLSKILKPIQNGKHNNLAYLIEFYSFEKPLFTADKKKALIHTYYHCGIMCGHGFVYFLELIDGKWKVIGYDYSYDT